MDRNQAKELLPIIKAFSEGKGIETKTGSVWISIENMSFAGNPDNHELLEHYTFADRTPLGIIEEE